MSDKILQVIDPDGEIKEQLQAIRENFLTLQKDSLKGAAQVLALSVLSADFATSSTTYTSVGLKASITTSGGLVMLVGVASDAGNFAHTPQMQLVLDDAVKASQLFGNGIGGSITWAGVVGAGVHVIDLQFLTNTGTMTLKGGLDNYTYLMAVEFII